MSRALELANELDNNADLDAAEGGNLDVCIMEHEAASLLRQQHKALEVALHAMEEADDIIFNEFCGQSGGNTINVCKTAINKIKELLRH